MIDPLTNVVTGATSRRPAGDGGEGNLEVQNAYPAWRTYEQRAHEQNRELVSALIQEVSV
jgi:hypothetical protein